MDRTGACATLDTCVNFYVRIRNVTSLQVLNFESYKKRGPMYLDKSFTERLLEQLEDAQALLAQMLTSKYSFFPLHRKYQPLLCVTVCNL